TDLSVRSSSARQSPERPPMTTLTPMTPMPATPVTLATSATPTPATPTTAPLPRRFAFYLLASIAVSFLAGSSAPTPLYAVYEAAWGFTPITITVVFGIYAIAVLGA